MKALPFFFFAHLNSLAWAGNRHIFVQKERGVAGMENIMDIAKLAGVSMATVSRVLNNSGSVKENTRQKVLKVIQEKGYTPSAAARGLSNPSLVKNIGLVVPDIENEFFTQLLKGVSLVCNKLGYNVFLFGTDESAEKEHHFLATAMEQRLSGLIMIPTHNSDNQTKEYLYNLQKLGVPVVLADRELCDTDFDGVYTDDEKSSYQAVEALVKAGHTKIALIEGSSYIKPHRDRKEGYLRVLQDKGMDICQEYIVQSDMRKQRAYEGTKKLLELRDPPTALFTVNNLSTLGALACFKEKGLQVGKDIAIIGMDDIEVLDTIGFGLSVVKRSVEEMGTEAMNLLANLMEADSAVPRVQRKVMLSSRLVLRGSETIERL